MNPIAEFLRWKWSWAVQKPWTWAFLGLCLGTIGVIWWWPGPVVGGAPSDTRLRAWALVLQLIGAGIVWHDLTSTAARFGNPGIWRAHVLWIRDGLRLRRIPANMTLHASSGALSAQSATLSSAAATGALTLATRVQMLEHAMRALQSDVQAQAINISAVKSELEAAIANERSQRAAAVLDLAERLKEMAAGNFGTLAFGAWWVAVGTVISALAPEIARLAAGQAAAVLLAL